MKYIVFAIVLLTTACITPAKQVLPSLVTENPDPPIFEDTTFGNNPSVVSLEQVYQLSDDQKHHFLNYFESAEQRTDDPNRRIYNYLQHYLSDFGFSANTLTASEALSNDQGNCLSLAILTKALANIVGVEVAYQLVATPAIYEKAGDLVLKSQHVRTLLFAPKQTVKDNYFMLTRGHITVDYFPVAGSRLLRSVDENEFYAMYYQNKAAEALINNDSHLAFWLLKKALEVNKNDSQAINMMAILHDQSGSPQQAEILYLHGLKYGHEKFSLLHNYHLLLVRLNKRDEAVLIAEQLAKYKHQDPFKWISLGEEKYTEGDFSSAISYFKKASKLADYLHEPYVGIAKAELSRGNLIRAKRAIKKAIDKANKNRTTSFYQKKYDSLSELVERFEKL